VSPKTIKLLDENMEKICMTFIKALSTPTLKINSKLISCTFSKFNTSAPPKTWLR
jgi:hypothetical protein